MKRNKAEVLKEIKMLKQKRIQAKIDNKQFIIDLTNRISDTRRIVKKLPRALPEYRQVRPTNRKSI